MQQTEKHKTQKYTAGRSPLWSTKYQTDVRDSSDANWKYLHKHNPSVPSNKANRRQFNATAEPVTNYHSTMNSYKQTKHHNCGSPTHTKYTTCQNTEPQRWTSHNQAKTPRNKFYNTNNNIAIVRRSTYNKNELEDDEKVRYADEELGNFTEDNPEEDAIEEVEDDQEETAESVDKDYEEHEADDEIDEESDSPILRSQKLQRRPKKDEISQEQQRSKIVKQQQDPRKLHYQQYVHNSFDSHPSRRRYYHDLDDRDATEFYSDEEAIQPPTPPKNSIRRLANYHQHWIPSRNSSDRYDTIASLNQSIRRPRARQDVENLLHSEHNNTKKCIRCGAPSGNRSSTTSKKNSCRFQEHPNFVVKESIGDDMDAVEKIICGRCNVKHNSEDIERPYRLTRSALQTLKPRRSKGSKGIYEVSEDCQIGEEIPNDYMTNRYSKDTAANTVHERTRHSAPTTRGANRSSSRYDA
ncbi:uncharacterized protein LOC122627782 [Vespula pensylvanica]|uniref:Uncharacterized protein n=1 Tax=Vespula pensylvanica TaxID=30213 RepID=A0A834UDA4_VESPE|nr:uncharacterized protein LOC122627782 [Vespula pensylvanica]KAF7431807.1 hypothetical protein H0235_004731 [Vespula pensylvanica]